MLNSFYIQVSLAALKSLQEMLQAGRSASTVASNYSEDPDTKNATPPPVAEDSIANWNTAWKVNRLLGIYLIAFLSSQYLLYITFQFKKFHICLCIYASGS